MRRRGPWTVLGATVAAVAVACGGGGGTPAPSPLRFADGGTCPVSSASTLPAGSGCVTSAVADLDGDGRADVFVVYARLRAGRPASWWAVALLARSGRTRALRLPTGQAVGGSAKVYPRVAGTAGADGEPGDEAFVQLSADLYHSGARPIEAMFGVRGGRLIPVTRSNGRLFTFPTGGISRFGDGALCERAGAVFATDHVSIESHGWSWSVHRYRWRGLRLVPDGERTGRLPAVSIADPRVGRFYRLICGALRISAVTDSYPRA